MTHRLLAREPSLTPGGLNDVGCKSIARSRPAPDARLRNNKSSACSAVVILGDSLICGFDRISYSSHP